jgi:hypothetical protein
MMFFVPGEEDAETAWDRMRQACGALVDSRPIYSMTYDEGGTEIVATVGEEGVAAITFGGTVFYIVDAADAPRSFSVESIMETAFFDDA